MSQPIVDPDQIFSRSSLPTAHATMPVAAGGIAVGALLTYTAPRLTGGRFHAHEVGDNVLREVLLSRSKARCRPARASSEMWRAYRPRAGQCWCPSSQWVRKGSWARSRSAGRLCRCHSSRPSLVRSSPARYLWSARTASSWMRWGCRGQQGGDDSCRVPHVLVVEPGNDVLEPVPQFSTQEGRGEGRRVPGAREKRGVADGSALFGGAVPRQVQVAVRAPQATSWLWERQYQR